MNDRIEALEIENEALRAKLAAWEASATVNQYQTELGLTAKEAAVLSLLVQRRRVERMQAYAAVFEQLNGDGPSLKIVDVFVCKLRKKLRAIGLNPTIKSIWGVGHEITPETIAAIEQRLSPPLAA